VSDRAATAAPGRWVPRPCCIAKEICRDRSCIAKEVCRDPSCIAKEVCRDAVPPPWHSPRLRVLETRAAVTSPSKGSLLRRRNPGNQIASERESPKGGDRRENFSLPHWRVHVLNKKIVLPRLSPGNAELQKRLQVQSWNRLYFQDVTVPENPAEPER